MSFPRYPKYKDSGVEWLGEVPEHWDVTRLKHAAHVYPSNVDKKSYEGEMPVRLCNYTDVYYNETITPSIEFMSATASPEQIAKFTLRAGDTIITKDSETADDIAIAAYVPEDLPGVVCGYHLAVIRPSTCHSGGFIKRLFDSSYVKSCVAVRANGLTRVGLGQYELDNIELAFPPAREQCLIARFLDEETEKIDALVAEQQRLIELLKEKRQAVISHAVTKGLSPDVPMKPSGFEWLSDIPAHWEATRLGRKIELQRGADITRDQQTHGDIPVVSSGGITSFHDHALRCGPGVVVGRKGTAGAIYYVESDYWPHDTTLYVKEFRGNFPRFVYYKLYSMDLASFDTGSANPTINRNLVHPTMVSWPPVREQVEIADFLDRETAKLDALVAEAERAIALLQERRTALISAAVTGKIDVRQLPSATEAAAA